MTFAATRQTRQTRPDNGWSPRSHGVLQRQCACGGHTSGRGECEHCRKKLRRKAASATGPASVPPVVHDVLRASGAGMDPASRAFFEPRFTRDFSNVRVHADEHAAQAAQAVDALAFTVGNHMVFGRGQYRPDSHNGRRLIAHELTHTVQQDGETRTPQRIGEPGDPLERQADGMAEAVLREASPPSRGVAGSAVTPGVADASLQRTPAPPSHGGTTGVRDLDKIRIDAVEDFLAGSLTSEREVNVHVNDARVKHLTWMFYDPRDQMMSGSFSTLPSSPRATSTPFKLRPSHFTGAGFVAGKHILRCSGLDAQHRPVVYADRDFNVLAADLTTGTALATTYGDLTFTKYSKTDASPPATPRYSVDVALRFLPKTSVTCTQVAFMQSMRTIDGAGRSQHNTINSEQDARKTPLAWSIDRLAGGPTPFYGTEADARGNIVIPPSKGRFGAGGASPSAAGLIDRPSWNQENVAQFESCAVCRSGANVGQVYGCATWGYRATASGRVTLMPRGFRQMPSDQFTEARAEWNRWRTTRPVASRPDEAPALKAP